MQHLWSNELELEQDAISCLQLSPTLSIHDDKVLRATFIDVLIYNAIFNENEIILTRSRDLIFSLSLLTNAPSSSIQPLYEAFGRKEVAGFTVPAINVRTLTYDTARLIFRMMHQHRIGAVNFEIARSEIEYTDQRPQEYAVAVLAAAIKEGHSGPVFLQGDHYQFSKTKFAEDKEAEIQRIKDLVKESIKGHFLNIDIDASTLVDFEKETLQEQQLQNSSMTALLTQYIRQIQPQNTTVSIGGEIGHIGGKNSTVDDFEAFIQHYRSLIEDTKGISKVSVQTGSRHGGTPLADGTLQKVTLDFSVLKAISTVAREKYGLGGAVQHGASTLPLEYFDNFVASQTLEIHLATGLQNIVYDNLPQDLKNEVYSWLKENLSEEKKDDWNEDQFIYKTRKKGFGPFKQVLWDMTTEEKKPILDALEQQLTVIFEKLHLFNTKDVFASYFKIDTVI
jgi:fructose/tagatose bisphosphate aldolase